MVRIISLLEQSVSACYDGLPYRTEKENFTGCDPIGSEVQLLIIVEEKAILNVLHGTIGRL